MEYRELLCPRRRYNPPRSRCGMPADCRGCQYGRGCERDLLQLVREIDGSAAGGWPR